MHWCLAIVEVQRAIFDHVYDDLKGPTTLARLACTCRVFHDAALDVLWASLDSFIYLIRCLPPDLWKVEPNDSKMTFQRPMSLKDWEIFFRYSSRVRSLHQSSEPDFRTLCTGLSNDVIFALSNPPTYGPLIPYLRKLTWKKPDKKYAPLLRFLLTPSLISLTLRDCTLHSPEVSILASICVLCPSLKSLCISSRKPFASIFNPEDEKIFSEALLYLHWLESLTCTRLDEVAIAHLAHLPLLSNLSFELKAGFQLEKILSYITPSAFTSIRSLRLHASCLLTLTSLLEHIRFKPTSVSFVVANAPTPDELRQFFLALTTACESEQLMAITLAAASEQPGRPQVSLSTFQSILSFPNIRRFVFEVPCNIMLDNDAIMTLTKRWPALTTLSFNAKYGWGIPSRVTHHGFILLLSRCPWLDHFVLTIDFTGVDYEPAEMPDTRPGNGVTNRKCSSANFATSIIQYPASIAALLSDVCPALESVMSAWYYRTSLGMPDMDSEEMTLYQERWEEVESLLPVFGAVRRQCMNWAEKTGGT